MTGEITGDQLRAWRTQRGLTQREIADAVGLKANAISAWEKGRSKIDAGYVRILREKYADVNAPADAGRLPSLDDQGALYRQLIEDLICATAAFLNESGKVATAKRYGLATFHVLTSTLMRAAKNLPLDKQEGVIDVIECSLRNLDKT